MKQTNISVKISVCLCTYNGEKYLEELLYSLVTQTRVPDEIIIFDDFSNDSTVDIINHYIMENKSINWKFHIQSQNKGWRINFHDAILATTGDYVFLCDQDDIWIKNKIEEMTLILEKSNSILLLASSFAIRYEDNYARKTKEQDQNMLLKKVCNTRDFINPRRPGCAYGFRKELIEYYNRTWDPSFAHDAMLWRIAFLLDGLYIYNFQGIIFRRHSNNASSFYGSRLSIEKYNDRLSSIKMTTKFLKKLEMLELSVKARMVLSKYKNWNIIRYKAYKDKNIKYLFKLLFNISSYDFFKNYLADVLLILISRLKRWDEK